MSVHVYCKNRSLHMHIQFYEAEDTTHSVDSILAISIYQERLSLSI